MTLPRDVVLHWAALRSVIPVVYLDGQKRGRVKWTRYQQDRPDPDLLGCWHRKWPDSLWAVITGPISYMWSLDFDGDSGRKLLDKWGLDPHRRSHSGGYHVDVELPDFRVPNLVSKTDTDFGSRFPGLDTRGQNGLIVISGTTPKGTYQTLRDLDPYSVEALPTDLMAHLRTRSESHRPRPPRPQSLRSPARSARSPLEVPYLDPVMQGPAARLLHQAVTRALGGAGRNNTGFWLCCQCRDRGFTEEQTQCIALAYQQALVNDRPKVVGPTGPEVMP